MRSIRVLRVVVLAFVLSVYGVRTAPAQARPDRLDGFGADVEQAIADWSVPGLAIGVVKDSTVVYAKGFGVRDTETEAPATTQTLFAIGSATKAFTAATLGMLQDDGQLDWTTPVREYLPRFRMKNEFASEEMTAVDLLTHRSGLPRHDLLWYGTDLGREELFQRLRYLEPSAPFRTTFQYQNLMYMTAGYLAGQLSGTSWEEVVRRRLFQPLDMETSNLSVEATQQASNYARPYAGGRDSLARIDFHPLDAIGPAGAINSTVDDMTNWVQLFLNEGQYGDQQLISAATMQRLTTPEVVVENFPLRFAPREAPYTMYALGWFVEPYRGHRLLQHGGNIDGFSALVGFMPDDGLGFVILTNKNATPVPYILMYTLIDRMLEHEEVDWNERVGTQWTEMMAAAEEGGGKGTQREEGAEPSHPLSDYRGRYTNPGYGTFAVTMEGDSLRGQYGNLGSTLRHYHYDVFTAHPELLGEELTLKVQFETDLDGTVEQVAIPLESAVDPIVFTRTASEELTAADYLQQFVGEYSFRGQTLTVRLRGDNALTLTVPGQPTYELRPTRENNFAIKDLSGFNVEFATEGGQVARMILHQPNGTFTAERK